MSGTSDDLDPETDSRELIADWSEAIVERLGPEGYLLTTLLSGVASFSEFSNGAALMGALWLSLALLQAIAFVRVLGTFEHGLKRGILCDRFAWHDGELREFDNSEIAVLQCKRCGKFHRVLVRQKYDV
ncbi:hypothetical protein [Halolamina salifodinae]|uniref:Uncharacterized protein n=1 Tax=Halolamina salifodinae TaxID=1202767 RepID=A0A8T4GWE0_9EURY|nr:hypothetical protein [Halolamina salifodinae]MBP1987226.1 hypothetical protein [Halolamina salifodinae]